MNLWRLTSSSTAVFFPKTRQPPCKQLGDAAHGENIPEGHLDGWDSTGAGRGCSGQEEPRPNTQI